MCLPLDIRELKTCLDALREHADACIPRGDPVELAHRYGDPLDAEIAGLAASALAYGNVKSILAKARAVLDLLGPSPRRAVERLEPKRALRVFSGFRHRFTAGRDVAALLWVAKHFIEQSGSIGGIFAYLVKPGEVDVKAGLVRLVDAAFEVDLEHFYGRSRKRPEGLAHLLPSPAAGSACKRLNLYLRWMVRPADGVDLGLWDGISPAKLVVPVDTHVARIARLLGLTRRKTATWATAREITDNLARLDPADPVKYDYALARLGMLRRCLRDPDPETCAVCELRRACKGARVID